MIAISSIDEKFPYEQVKELYIKHKKYFDYPDYPFKNFVNDKKRHLWAFVEGKKLIGYIFMHSFTENSCFLSGNADRKTTKYITEAIQGICGFYFTNYKQLQRIYADTPHRHARIALLRAGFNDKFYIERANNERKQTT